MSQPQIRLISGVFAQRRDGTQARSLMRSNGNRIPFAGLGGMQRDELRELLEIVSEVIQMKVDQLSKQARFFLRKVQLRRLAQSVSGAAELPPCVRRALGVNRPNALGVRQKRLHRHAPVLL